MSESAVAAQDRIAQPGVDYPLIIREIERVVGEICAAKNLPKPMVTEGTPLLGGKLGLDSLDLASIVLQLETLTERDPFAQGFVNFRTVSDLARLFEK